MALININITCYIGLAYLQANSLIGVPTSSFPNEAFLNYILYGHSDVPFHYNDFLSSFGVRVPSFTNHGNLVIGVDGKLGGIALDNNDIAIPIPQGQITRVSISNLQKYFPNGYVIIDYPFTWNYYKQDSDTNVILNNTVICQESCSGNIEMSELTKGNIFIENNNLIYEFMSPSLHAQFIGFLSKFDPILENGILNITYCYVSWFGYGFIETNAKNNILINTGVGNVYLNGTIEVKSIGGSGTFYLFSKFTSLFSKWTKNLNNKTLNKTLNFTK